MNLNTFDVLRKVVGGASYKLGYTFHLVDDDEGFRLVITDHKCVDAYDPAMPFMLRHYFPVPTTTWNEATWRRWIHTCCLGMETHELGEWLRWDNERPFAPLHGPGEDPYVVHEFRSDEDRRTTQDGSMR